MYFDEADRIVNDRIARWSVEPARYRLVVSPACPWSERLVIVRGLLGLDQAIPLATVGPVPADGDWAFDLDPAGVDPVLGISHLRQAYERRFPGYDGPVTVLAFVDRGSGMVVDNAHRRLTLDLTTEWVDHAWPDAPDLYPQQQRAEIDDLVALFRRWNGRFPPTTPSATSSKPFGPREVCGWSRWVR